MNRRATAAVAAGSLVAVMAGLGSPAVAAAAQRRTPVTIIASNHAKRVPPVDADLMHPALAKYRTYVHGLIAKLRPDVSQLTLYLTLGDVSDARQAWLTAHLVWLRIGQDDAAYSAFGQLGQRIDGLADGDRLGTADPHFTGFHRIEWDLWHRDNLAAARTDTANLKAAVTKLSHVNLETALPGNAAGVSNWILRAHEITEDAVRDTLSGNDDYGSGTGLASTIADITATREMLTLLAPVLKPRSPHLVGKARKQLSRWMSAAKAGREGGNWIPVAQLSRHERERVDSAAGAADETLAPIPDLLRIGNS